MMSMFIIWERKISNIIFNDYMRNWTKIKVIDNLEEGKEHG